MRHVKQGSNTGKESPKQDGKQQNQPTQTKNIRSFFTSDKSKEAGETPNDSESRAEHNTDKREKDAGPAGEQRTEDTSKDSGHGQEARTVEEKMTHCDDEDDRDDGVLFPLSGPGIDWYRDKGVKFNANLVRTEERMKNTVIMEGGEIKGLVRGSATGTLSENIDVLIDKLSSAASSKQQDHLSAMISIGHFIMNNRLIIPTQILTNKYKELKGLKDSTHIESARLLEVLTKHLNMVQIYIDGN